jgi:hypothetical protein
MNIKYKEHVNVILPYHSWFSIHLGANMMNRKSYLCICFNQLMSESFSYSRITQHFMEPNVHQCVLISRQTVNIVTRSGNILTDYCPYLTLDIED